MIQNMLRRSCFLPFVRIRSVSESRWQKYIFVSTHCFPFQYTIPSRARSWICCTIVCYILQWLETKKRWRPRHIIYWLPKCPDPAAFPLCRVCFNGLFLNSCNQSIMRRFTAAFFSWRCSRNVRSGLEFELHSRCNDDRSAFLFFSVCHLCQYLHRSRMSSG